MTTSGNSVVRTKRNSVWGVSDGHSALVRAELFLLGNYGPHAFTRLDATIYSYGYHRGKKIDTASHEDLINDTSRKLRPRKPVVWLSRASTSVRSRATGRLRARSKAVRRWYSAR